MRADVPGRHAKAAHGSCASEPRREPEGRLLRFGNAAEPGGEEEHTSELQSHSHLVCRSSDVCSRSEEHTSELQSHSHLVCRLLLEKKIEMDSVDHASAVSETHCRVRPHRLA